MAPAVDPASLQAVTRRAADRPDELGWDAAGSGGVLFQSGAVTLAGEGVAAELPLPKGLSDTKALRRIQSFLAAIEHDDEVGVPGSSPTAHGLFAYDPTRPTTLVVPSYTTGVNAAGRRWHTFVAPHDEIESVMARPHLHSVPGRGANHSEITLSEPNVDRYFEGLRQALKAIDAGTITKVVLAREVLLTMGVMPPASVVLRRFLEAEPTTTVFSHPVPGGRFIGASPELLISRRASIVRSHPLAGTMPAGHADILMASAKDTAEHRLVVDAIVAQLQPLCRDFDIPDGPRIHQLTSVTHLGTPLQGALEHPAPNALELLARIHPTPAVGGTPDSAARHLIDQLEPFDRGVWAGAVGWMDAAGDGDWFLAIRSVLLEAHRARLIAGGGIVAGSDPELEFDETIWKLAPVLEAVAPGSSRLLAPA